ncbi:MAG: endonuclease [Streptomycetaceae bacterium]|jgi:endonuclease/exonuclease/phosphatase family metal-dependent hydrolase|nr:endonuclease [Streptomycetaceae bacterium]NUS59148.1 endonuclease [Streptomycetaceae bacterium]
MATPPPVELRVLSYNVRSLRDDRRLLARIVRWCAADVVLVQEAPRFLLPKAQAAWLARACGLHVVGGGAAATGPLILATLGVKVLETRNVLLPRTPGYHQRGIALARLQVDGVRFAVGSTHLSLDGDERRRQADLVLTHLADLGEEHRILAGDMNEHPGHPAWDHLAANLDDAYAAAPWGREFTSPHRNPWRRIDGIFVSSEIEVVRCGVPDAFTDAEYEAATDHRPVLAVLRLPAG